MLVSTNQPQACLGTRKSLLTGLFLNRIVRLIAWSQIRCCDPVVLLCLAWKQKTHRIPKKTQKAQAAFFLSLAYRCVTMRSSRTGIDGAYRAKDSVYVRKTASTVFRTFYLVTGLYSRQREVHLARTVCAR
jgi:hypothetical protein